MTYPVFATGDVLPASDMNAIGLWLVKTQTVGSGVSSVTVTGAFSSTYDNYLVTYINGTGGGTYLQMTIGNATSGYYYQLIYANYTSSVVSANVPDNNAARFTYVGTANNSTYLEARISAPFLSVPTRIATTYVDSTVAGQGAGLLNNSNSYTSFTITPALGTLTGGTIRVYGYRN